MRVEIDEEKKGKEMAFALSISMKMIYSPPPPNQSSQGIRTSTFVSILNLKTTNFCTTLTKESKSRKQSPLYKRSIHPSSSRLE